MNKQEGHPSNPADSTGSPQNPSNPPGYSPNQPGYSPNQPSYSPNQPGYSPNQPSYSPNQPGYSPNQPGYSPNQPGYSTNQPGYSPNQPGSSPNQPGYSPNPKGPPPNSQGYPSIPPGQQVNAPYPVPISSFVQTTNYSSQPQPGVIITTQSNLMVLPQPAYKDYLAWSVLNLIFCNLIFGIVAVVFSSKTRDAVRRGDSFAAGSYSRTTFSFNVAALVLGIAGHICWIALSVTYNRRYYYYYSSNYQYYG
ncbi:uncharacterized protein LOC143933499 [Lithobates pipiens]